MITAKRFSLCHRVTALSFIVLLWFAAPGATAQTASPTTVTGAGGAVLSAPAILGGVTLNGMTFGINSFIANGGYFVTRLPGTTVTGVNQQIVVAGVLTSGSLNSSGNATFSGTASVDMGDGSLPATVPVVVTASPGAKGLAPTLTLTVGTNALPVAAVNEGSLRFTN